MCGIEDINIEADVKFEDEDLLYDSLESEIKPNIKQSTNIKTESDALNDDEDMLVADTMIAEADTATNDDDRTPCPLCLTLLVSTRDNFKKHFRLKHPGESMDYPEIDAMPYAKKRPKKASVVPQEMEHAPISIKTEKRPAEDLKDDFDHDYEDKDYVPNGKEINNFDTELASVIKLHGTHRLSRHHLFCNALVGQWIPVVVNMISCRIKSH